mgnify:CR=1 FL=1
MKTIPDSKIMKAINAVSMTRSYIGEDFQIIAHAESDNSEYWGLQSYRFSAYYLVTRHGRDYMAYECNDRIHIRYLLVKMAF